MWLYWNNAVGLWARQKIYLWVDCITVLLKANNLEVPHADENCSFCPLLESISSQLISSAPGKTVMPVGYGLVLMKVLNEWQAAIRAYDWKHFPFSSFRVRSHPLTWHPAPCWDSGEFFLCLDTNIFSFDFSSVLYNRNYLFFLWKFKTVSKL